AEAASARDGIVKHIDPESSSGPTGTGLGEDEGQELNFDRRAPLAMRLEPAPTTTTATATPARLPTPLPPSARPGGGGAAVPALAGAGSSFPGNQRREIGLEDSVTMEVPRRRGWLLVAAVLLFAVAAMVFTVLK